MTTQRNLMMTLAVAAFAVLAAGSAFADDPTPDTSAAVVSQKSRAELQAEVRAARASGELNAFVGEDSGSFYLARQAAKQRRAAAAAHVARAN